MFVTCKYVISMSKMIQLRHVPDELHRKLKVRAAREGMTLSDYLIREVKLAAEQPTLEEILERISRRSRVTLPVSPAEVVRQERVGAILLTRDASFASGHGHRAKVELA
jgi:plasmid stability protein